MAIPVKRIKEGCCDNDLSEFTVIDGDALDAIGSTCDKIIECSDKYILVEEKSIIFAFFDNCCRDIGINLDSSYKYRDNHLEYINITKIIEEVINPMDINIKKRIFSETVSDMLITSSKKVSNTTHILATAFDNSKTADMKIFYLYCRSGNPIDRIIHTLLSRNRKNPFIECQCLKNRLEQIC
ncbi:MAG: hypothetical protein U9P38_02705 [Campylobacterota bacterium]|nr:hypothetical protein [Campylobacterota bacterium]